jgi:hypothetical protein
MQKEVAFSMQAVTLLVAAALSPALAQQPNAKPAPPSATVPGFSVTLTYSQKAMDTLVGRKETVIVAGYLYGFPQKDTPKKYVDEIGQVDLGEIHDEVAPGAAATFASIKLDPSLLKWIDTQGPQLLINVYSGRKSSENNLLDCGLFEGPLKDAQGKSLPISCKLIGE